jgi:hypothetical protein
MDEKDCLEVGAQEGVHEVLLKILGDRCFSSEC